MARENNTRSFVLRVDAATMDALEAWAEDEFRSINGQLQWIIADALRRSGRLKRPRAAASGTASPESAATKPVGTKATTADSAEKRDVESSPVPPSAGKRTGRRTEKPADEVSPGSASVGKRTEEASSAPVSAGKRTDEASSAPVSGEPKNQKSL